MGKGKSQSICSAALINILTICFLIDPANARAADPASPDPKAAQDLSSPSSKTSPNRASCQKHVSDLTKLASDTEFGFDISEKIRSGEGLAFHWSVPLRFETGSTVYMAVSVSGEARVEAAEVAPPADKATADAPDASAENGSVSLPGFIVLRPSSPGLRKIAFGTGTTRVFIPLDREGSHLSGSLTIRLYEAGAYTLKSAIIAMTPCGETALKTTSEQSASVIPAAAEIVVQDPYDIAVPKTAILSNDGRYLLQIFEGFYRVFNVASGAKLVDRSGHDPNFSPTGRFVAANTGAGEAYEITDLVSRQPVATVSGPFVGWTEEDAYVIDAGAGDWPAIGVTPTLISMPANTTKSDLEQNGEDDGVSISARSPEKNAPAWEAFGLKIDIDAGYVAFSNLTASSKATKAGVFDIATGREMPARPITKGWVARSPIHFSHVFSVSTEKTCSPEWAQEQAKSSIVKELSKLKATHKILDQTALLNLQKASAPSVDWRAARPITRSLDQEANITSLSEEFARFGIKLATEVPRKELPAPFSALRATVGIDEAMTESPQSISQIEAYRTQLIREVPAAQQILKEGMLSDQSVDLSRQLEGLWRWEVKGAPLWLLQGVEGQGSGGFAEINCWMLRGDPPGGKVQAVLGDLPEGYNPHVTDLDDKAVRPKARVFLDRYLVMGMAGPKVISIIDLQGERPNVLIQNLPQADLLADVRLTSDGRHVIQINSDGEFFFHDIALKKLVLSGRFVDGEILFYTPEGYYWSSYEGAHFVQLRFPGLPELASFRQFASILNRPDFVKAQLSERSAPLPQPLLTPPPRLSLQLADEPPNDGQPQDIPIHVHATSSVGLEKVRLYFDGQLVKEEAVTGNDVENIIRVHPSPNARWLTALAIDRKGVISTAHALRLSPSGKRSNALYAVVAGVDKYSPPRLNLQFARSDATRFAAALKARHTIYYATQTIDLLSDESATTQSILSALQVAVAHATPQDTVLFFFAGHGVQGRDGRYYLAPSNLQLNDVAHTGLPWAELASVLGKSQARVVSGAEGLATNDDAVSGLLSGSHAPVLVLAASKGRESSFEGEKWQGGVFTYALSKILSEGLSPSGAIDVSDLYRQLRKIVARETDGQQTPWLARQDLIGDFAIF
jgi:hypothetical protein